MGEYVLKLQKNIFAITVATAVVLGIALAYLGAVALRFFLSSNTPTVTLNRVAPVADTNRTSFRSVDEFLGIVTGDFIRDSGAGAPGEDGAEAPTGVQGEIELMGVLFATPLRYARALIKQDNAKSAESYAIGNKVGESGYKLIGIHPEAVTVEAGGSRLKIKVGEKSGEARTAAQTTAQDTATSGGGEKVTLSKDRFQQLIKNPEEIYKNKFSPVLVNGKIAGWKLIYVPNDNFLHQLGARSGDILRRFNGQPLESQEKMIQMWQSLQSASSVTVDIERGGKIFTYKILIQ